MTSTGPRTAPLILVTLAMAAVAVLAVVFDARVAITGLAVILAAAGLLRAVLSETVVPVARSRGFDVTVLLVLAAALLYLAPWGNATLPAGA